jgi:hypothetical protein
MVLGVVLRGGINLLLFACTLSCKRTLLAASLTRLAGAAAAVFQR